ncbi:unnamed protein product, partial [marine sediment metagenome]
TPKKRPFVDFSDTPQMAIFKRNATVATSKSSPTVRGVKRPFVDFSDTPQMATTKRNPTAWDTTATRKKPQQPATRQKVAKRKVQTAEPEHPSKVFVDDTAVKWTQVSRQGNSAVWRPSKSVGHGPLIKTNAMGSVWYGNDKRGWTLLATSKRKK